MVNNLEILVPAGQKRERIDVFLAHQIENATRSKMQRAILEGHVKVNGDLVKPSHKVSPGEIVNVSLPKSPAPELLAENIPLDVLYEDKYLLVVNKPAGMVTHPAYGNYSGTLVNALLHHCKGELSLEGKANDSVEAPRPGIVHRLDKDTSGLLVVAKDGDCHAKLARQFTERTIEREYVAIVWGHLRQPRGIIEASLGRSKSDRKKVAVIPSGRHAVTEYEVTEIFDFLSLVRLRLRTGRTHQIRVHLHHVGHPIFGDPTYGGRRIVFMPRAQAGKMKEEVKELLKLISRQALHARTLAFIHPINHKKLNFESELPSDFAAVLQRLRKQKGD